MVTVAEIAATALDAVSDAITDAVHDGEMFEILTGAYDTTTGTMEQYRESRGTCRAVFATETPIGDVFPDYVSGPQDTLVFLEGISAVPREGWILCTDQDYVVTRAQDILAVGSIVFAVVKRDG